MRAFEGAGHPTEDRIRHTADSPESLFRALDGRRLLAEGRSWTVEVFSVSELGNVRYVQMALNGLERYLLTMRIGRDADVGRLIPRLLDWLGAPRFGEILTVA